MICSPTDLNDAPTSVGGFSSMRTTRPSFAFPTANPTPLSLSNPEDTVSTPSSIAFLTAGNAAGWIIPFWIASSVGAYPADIDPSGLVSGGKASSVSVALSMASCCDNPD